VAARALGDLPRPEIASVGKGEWLLTWNDVEAQHIETFAARVVCR
jgi:hypothetical protein